MPADTTALATVSGTMLTPGVSRNNRLYTKETITKAVIRMRSRIADPDGLPIVMRTHHDAGDNSTLIVGRITSVAQDETTGAANYQAELYGTAAGRDIAALVTPKKPALRTVSIHGYWVGPVKRVNQGGAMVETADDLEVDAVDFTASPGVTGAVVHAASVASAEHDVTGRVAISESAEAQVSAIAEYSTAQLTTMAGKGQAMANDAGDPAYPIKTKADLRKAIRAVGRGGADHNKIRAHIIGRAKSLGLANMLPTNWNEDGSMTETSNTVAAAAVAEAYVTICIGGDQGNLVQICVDGADADSLKKAAKKAAKIAANFLCDDSGDGDLSITITPDDADDMVSAETVTITRGGRRLTAAETAATLARLTRAATPNVPATAGQTTTESKEPVVTDTTTTGAGVVTAAPAPALSEADIAKLGAAIGAAVKEAMAANTKKVKEKAGKEKPAKAATTETAATTATSTDAKPQLAETVTPAELEVKLAQERAKTIAEIRETLLKENGLPERKGFRHVAETDGDKAPTGEDLWNRRGEVWAPFFPPSHSPVVAADAAA